MRRQVWLILGGLAAGVALVSLLAFDAGYVLIQFGSVSTRDNAGSGRHRTIPLLWIVRVSFRFLSAILGLGPGVGRWLEKRREDKASALLRETLIAMFDERTDTVVQRLPKLMKGDLFSDAERVKADVWVLKRQLEATAKPDQLKRVWSGAKARTQASSGNDCALCEPVMSVGALERRGIRITGAVKTWLDSFSARLGAN